MTLTATTAKQRSSPVELPLEDRAPHAAPADVLEARIREQTARLSVVGLGYVGLPLGLAFGEAGFPVTGIDVDAGKVAALKRGRSHVTDVSDLEVHSAVAGGRLVPTDDWEALEHADVVTICVPTPLRKTKDPDLTYVVSATEEVARRLHPGQLVILESTTYPGTTEEVVLPKLEASGLTVGEDFFLAFSPERVDPGNQSYRTRDIPKVVGGVTPRCTELAAALYGQCVSRVVPVSCTRVAEMVKLLENTFRSVNIALVNEMALMCSHMGIDVWEVIAGAATKPFGFMPFYPGPGLGGHCIPIDPIYLQWRARIDGFEPQFIQLAQKVNGDMPAFVVRRAMDLLNEAGKPLKGSRVHVLGVTYKKDISDVRESPALEILRLLAARGAETTYTDPYAPELEIEGRRMASHRLDAAFLAGRDLAVLVTDHSAFDYPDLAAHAPLILDTRNALAELRAPNVRKL